MSGLRDQFARLTRAAIDRIRDEPNLAWFVANGLRLGEHATISHPLYIDRTHPWLITIGDYAVVSPYCALITHDPSLAGYTGQTRLGRVDIGDRVRLGVGAILLPGTLIGEDSVIGAGAVVQGEIPPRSIVHGNPGKVSPIKAAVAWHRVSAKSAPSWPNEGWTVDSIDEERRREQRDALAHGASGFVPARVVPGSPYATRRQAEAQPTETTARG
jgi:maltose O-acetyltransferase